MAPPDTPPGWYSDPEQAGMLRYWDGSAWTDHRSATTDPKSASANKQNEALLQTLAIVVFAMILLSVVAILAL